MRLFDDHRIIDKRRGGNDVHSSGQESLLSFDACKEDIHKLCNKVIHSLMIL